MDSVPVIRDVCGTDKGYQRHLYNHELSCETCLIAHREYGRKYAKNNFKLKTYKQNQRELNPEMFRESNRKWKRNNPEKVKADKRHRRSLEHSVESQPYLLEDLLTTYGLNCYLCNEEIDLKAPRTGRDNGWEKGLHIDHVVPLSKGGNGLIKNLRPTHAQCNLRKHANKLEE